MSANLHPSLVKLGKLVSDQVVEITRDSHSMNIFGEIQLLNVLVLWTGYNHILRKDQKRILDWFYDCFVGLLHGTNKMNYQENMFFYNVFRDCLSPVAYHVV